MKRYFMIACLAGMAAIACAQKVVGDSIIKLTSFTQEGMEAYVILKNTGDKEVASISYRIYYKDLKGNDIDYADYRTDRSIEPGLSRRFEVRGYGEPGEFIYNENKKNFKYTFEIREVRFAHERSNTMGGVFVGSSTGDTKKGNPAASGSGTGSGTSESGRWSIAGRSLIGSLPQPKYSSNAEGTVVVRIRINAAGQVVEASAGHGSTTSDQSLIGSAIAAAKKATFSAGEGDVIGSITYVFKLK